MFEIGLRAALRSCQSLRLVIYLTLIKFITLDVIMYDSLDLYNISGLYLDSFVFKMYKKEL